MKFLYLLIPVAFVFVAFLFIPGCVLSKRLGIGDGKVSPVEKIALKIVANRIVAYGALSSSELHQLSAIAVEVYKEGTVLTQAREEIAERLKPVLNSSGKLLAAARVVCDARDRIRQELGIDEAEECFRNVALALFQTIYEETE